MKIIYSLCFQNAEQALLLFLMSIMTLINADHFLLSLHSNLFNFIQLLSQQIPPFNCEQFLTPKIIKFIIFKDKMIRIRPSLPRPAKSISSRKKINGIDQENIRPVVFNTKGYFDPSVPYDEQYLKVKQKVFEKYRNKKEEFVMLDIKQTNRGAFIQKGLLIPSKSININEEQKINSVDKLSQNLLKNYLIRKEKRQMHDLQKFSEAPKISCDQLTSRNNTFTSRTHSRHVSSRISTTSVLKMEADF